MYRCRHECAVHFSRATKPSVGNVGSLHPPAGSTHTHTRTHTHTHAREQIENDFLSSAPDWLSRSPKSLRHTTPLVISSTAGKQASDPICRVSLAGLRGESHRGGGARPGQARPGWGTHTHTRTHTLGSLGALRLCSPSGDSLPVDCTEGGEASLHPRLAIGQLAGPPSASLAVIAARKGSRLASWFATSQWSHTPPGIVSLLQADGSEPAEAAGIPKWPKGNRASSPAGDLALSREGTRRMAHPTKIGANVNHILIPHTDIRGLSPVLACA